MNVCRQAVLKQSSRRMQSEKGLPEVLRTVDLFIHGCLKKHFRLLYTAQGPEYSCFVPVEKWRKSKTMSEIRIKTLVVGMVGTNCYLVYDNETKKAAVVDPGDSADKIVNMAVSLGLKPEAILLTHGHFDHMMAAKELKEAWHVPIYACEKEIEVLSDSRKSLVSRLLQGIIYADTGYYGEGG